MATDVPVLTDGVVTLRAHSDTDIDAMVEMCRDPQMARWTSVPQPYGREHALHFVHEVIRVGWERDHRGWAIEAVDDDGVARFAGNVDVRGVPLPDIGYALHPWARGRGVMSRALRLACRWAFEHGGAEVVHWRAHVGNVDSRRVAWRCGFSFHGTVPRLLHERGRVIDAWVATLAPEADGQPVTRWLEPARMSGEQVVLRPFRDSDARRLVESCDERTRYWIPGWPDPYTESDARRYLVTCIERESLGTAVAWCVADPDTDDLLGVVELVDLGGCDPTGRVGYWAHPDGRGEGVTGEAVRMAAEHGFGSLGLRRLSLGAAVGNVASRRVAEQAGFVPVGRSREEDRLGDGTYSDVVWYDRLAEE